MWSEIAIIRRILFWKYTDTVKAEHKEAEALAFLQKSVATMVGHIEGLRCAEINTNTAGGEYDLVFYSELRDADALQTSLDKGTQRKTTENELPSLTQCTA